MIVVLWLLVLVCLRYIIKRKPDFFFILVRGSFMKDDGPHLAGVVSFSYSNLLCSSRTSNISTEEDICSCILHY